jgi:hypothetical protein
VLDVLFSPAPGIVIHHNCEHAYALMYSAQHAVLGSRKWTLAGKDMGACQVGWFDYRYSAFCSTVTTSAYLPACLALCVSCC